MAERLKHLAAVQNVVGSNTIRAMTEKLSLITQPLRERLRYNNVFTKDQCFYLNYHKFSIKLYVLDVY